MTSRPNRRLAALATFAALALLVTTGCKGNSTTGDAAAAAAKTEDAAPELLELRYQGNVGAVSFAELAEDLGYLAPVKLNWIGNTTSGPQDIQSAATGQTDFGGAFNGAIIKLISAGSPIQSVISYYGSDPTSYQAFYVLDGSPIRSARDLIGKKVAMNTLGAHIEAVLVTWLRSQGLSEDEIKQVERVVLPPVNTDEALRQNQIDVAALGGIIQDKAVARGGIRKILSDVDFFGPFDAGTYVLRKDFIAKNPNTAKKFVGGVAKAIEWTQSHPVDEVKAKFTEIITKRKRTGEDTSLVAFWKSPGVTAKGGVIDEKNFTRWFEWLEKNGDLKPGQVKPADLYSNALNPYADGKAPS
jgi:ABC-type nitrate/sulfonate/bicarbonate transport system substrate-binding protein